MHSPPRECLSRHRRKEEEHPFSDGEPCAVLTMPQDAVQSPNISSQMIETECEIADARRQVDTEVVEDSVDLEVFSDKICR